MVCTKGNGEPVSQDIMILDTVYGNGFLIGYWIYTRQGGRTGVEQGVDMAEGPNAWAGWVERTVPLF